MRAALVDARPRARGDRLPEPARHRDAAQRRGRERRRGARLRAPRSRAAPPSRSSVTRSVRPGRSRPAFCWMMLARRDGTRIARAAAPLGRRARPGAARPRARARGELDRRVGADRDHEQLVRLRREQLLADPRGRAVVNRVELLRWAAWAPGIATQEAWQAWARAPQRALGSEAPPRSRFLPALQRRRCDALWPQHARGRAGVLPRAAPRRGVVRVRARYGPIATTVGLLRDLATRSPLSPARFSALRPQRAGRAVLDLGAQRDSRRAPWPEAPRPLRTASWRLLRCSTAKPRVRCCSSSRTRLLPEPFGALAERLDGAYAVGLLLGDGDGQGSLQLRLEPARGSASASAWPDALEFLRWWIAGEPQLCLTRGPRAWVWTRRD